MQVFVELYKASDSLFLQYVEVSLKKEALLFSVLILHISCLVFLTITLLAESAL